MERLEEAPPEVEKSTEIDEHVAAGFIDMFAPFHEGIPYGLLIQTSEVLGPYLKTLNGTITDPEEICRITLKFNDWYSQIKTHHKHW